MAGDGSGLDDSTAKVSAIFCENLLGPAVDEVFSVASHRNPQEAKRRIAALLEAQARREALRRKAIITSYEDGDL